MKLPRLYYLVISFFASTLCAEIFEDNEVSHAYDLEMNADESVIKYFVDTSYYDQFSAEVLGVYILYNEIPLSILKDTKSMTKILKRYLEVFVTNNDLDNKGYKHFNEIISINLFERYSNKYESNHSEIRHIQWILERGKKEFSRKNVIDLYNAINQYNQQKKDFYVRQNNYRGIAFCDEIQKVILNPLAALFSSPKVKIRENYLNSDITSLNKEELKLFWGDFKKHKLGLLNAYFNANDEKLTQLDANNTFQVQLDYVEWNGMPKYYICLYMFGQKWYLKIDDYYISSLHKVSLLKL